MGDSSEKEPDSGTPEIEWDVHLEIQLFLAMANHKPVGINKHFQMAAICEQLRKATTQRITSAGVWKHLNTLYDLSKLEHTEPIPFPNEEKPFTLPQKEFGKLMRQKRKKIASSDESEAGPSNMEIMSDSSNTSTDTQSIKFEMDYEMNNSIDSQDSNKSGTIGSPTSRKSTTYKENPSESISTASSWETLLEEDTNSGHGKKLDNNTTLSDNSPAKWKHT
ncbi:hypothetical protein ACJJTC_015902 [Scirpophaga incertulas]